jgi:hypothetical protein
MDEAASKSATVCPHGMTLPVKLVPDWVSCTRDHNTNVPLPDESALVLGQVADTVSLSAYTPVRLHDVVHTPALHCGVPPFAGQTRPHIPQFDTVLSAVSQPFGRLASQSPKPALQLGEHADATQLVLPCALLQTVAQLPQWAGVVASAISQPLAAAVSQSA